MARTAAYTRAKKLDRSTRQRAGGPGGYDVPRHTQIAVVDAKTGGDRRILTAPLDRTTATSGTQARTAMSRSTSFGSRLRFAHTMPPSSRVGIIKIPAATPSRIVEKAANPLDGRRATGRHLTLRFAKTLNSEMIVGTAMMKPVPETLNSGSSEMYRIQSRAAPPQATPYSAARAIDPASDP